VNPIFGRLLARQFAEMWDQLERPNEFLLVEAAVATGRLAAQILDFAHERLPEFYGSMRYVAVERSLAQCHQMNGRLAPHIEREVCRVALEVPAKIPVGCVFSNELLDALPVHRVIQSGGALQEVFVAHGDSKFFETTGPVSTCAITEYFSAQRVALEEGQWAEAGLEACDWIMEIGRRLERGFVLTIDYGHEASDLFDARHMAGTVLAYGKHRASEDFYAAPGHQDLTAHVNFTALRMWGERSGLKALGLVSQAAFLMALGKGNEFRDLYNEGMSETERVKARLQLKTLIFPEGMGERFQVKIQAKYIEQSRLTGLQGI